jgi:predicted DNA binding CopG/RHH family protein
VEDDLESLQAKLRETKSELLIKNVENSKLNSRVTDLYMKVESLNQDLAAKDKEIQKLLPFKTEKHVLNQEFKTEMETNLRIKDEEISSLKDKLKDLKSLKSQSTRQKKEIGNLRSQKD